MKKSILKRITLLSLSAMLALGTLSGCSMPGKKETTEEETKKSSKKEKKTTEEETEKAKKKTTEEETKEKETKEKETKEKETKEEKKTKESKKDGNSTLSTDVYAFQMKIGETVYSLPVKFSDLTSDGWVYDELNSESETDMIDANYTAIVQIFSKEDEMIYANIYNFDNSAKPLNECYIISLQTDTGMIDEQKYPVELPGGIELGKSTTEDVKDAYGDPSDQFDSDSIVTYTYEKDYNNLVELMFYKDKNMLMQVKVESMEEPEDFAKSEVSSEIPEIVSRYKIPQEISDNFADYVISFDGDMYTAPVLVSAMEDNGWIRKEDSVDDTTVAGRDTGWVTLTRNDKELRLMVKNYSSQVTSVDNCFGINISAGKYDCDVPMTIAKNISIGSTGEEVAAAIEGSNYRKDESNLTTIYSVMPGESMGDNYSISVSKDTNTVTRIAIFYIPDFDTFLK